MQNLPESDQRSRTPLSNPLPAERSTTAGTIPVLLCGLLAAGLFYASAPFVSGIDQFVRRYFCSHPIEIATTILFFCAMAILIHRMWQMRRERHATVAIQSAATDDPGSDAEAPGRWCESLPERQRYGVMVERIHGALRYVAGSGHEGLENHMRYLAELAADRLHQSYALVRTITWAIPILGFLGTVHGITIAIANLTPEQLDTSLPEVVGGLEAAFDTTALALAMSIGLVFTAFKTERSEQELLNTVERFGIDQVLPRFAVASASAVVAIPGAEEWDRQCRELQQAWSETLQNHFHRLSDQLQLDVDSTLEQHRESGRQAQSVLHASMQQTAASYAETISSSTNGLADRITHWQQAMQESTTAAAAQTEALHELGRTLLKMQESEERLAGLQMQLNENLQAVQAADALEQAVSSLSAAVNVLTTKTSGRRSAA